MTTITTAHPQGARVVDDAFGTTYFVGDGPPATYSASWWSASLKTVLQLHALKPFDVLVGHGKSAYGYLGARTHLPPAQHVPVVVITHNNVVCDLQAYVAQAARGPHKLLRWLPQGVATYADDLRRLHLAERITALSTTTAAPLNRWFRLDPSRIVVIPNGVDVAAYTHAESLRGPMRHHLGIDDQTCMILVLARLIRYKGQHYLLDAVAHLATRSSGRPVRLVLAGDGPAQDELMTQAARLGLSECTMFTGQIPHDEVPALLNAADIVALPSLREGMPLSLLEAMASGRPIVASNISTIADFVHDDVSGVLVAPGNTLALANGLAKLIDNPEYAHTLGECARATAQRLFEQRDAVTRYEQVFFDAAAMGGHYVG